MSINRYMYVTVNKRFDETIRVSYTKTEIVRRVDDLEHNLIREAMRKVGITGGIEVTTIADLPAGIGLGSSSATTVGVLNALHAYQGRHVSAEELARQACEIEIDVLGKPCRGTVGDGVLLHTASPTSSSPASVRTSTTAATTQATTTPSSSAVVRAATTTSSGVTAVGKAVAAKAGAGKASPPGRAPPPGTTPAGTPSAGTTPTEATPAATTSVVATAPAAPVPTTAAASPPSPALPDGDYLIVGTDAFPVSGVFCDVLVPGAAPGSVDGEIREIDGTAEGLGPFFYVTDSSGFAGGSRAPRAVLGLIDGWQRNGVLQGGRSGR